MSHSSLFVSSGIEHPSLRIHLSQKIGIVDAGGVQQVNVPSQNRLQPLLKLEKPCRQVTTVSVVEVIKEIEVAVRQIELPGDCRPEYLEPSHAESGAQFA